MDFLEHEIEEILNIFREESEEQIQKLNKNLLKLEANPKDSSAISELFREAHSLKGASRMIGLNDIQCIAHKLEDIFGLAKDGFLKVSPETTDILCKAVDFISSIVEESIETQGRATFPKTKDIIKELEQLEEGKTSVSIQADEEPEKKLTELELKDIYKNNKNLIIQIKVNIEKLKIFSTNTDALEELLFFVEKLDEPLNQIKSQRLSGIINDIKFKLSSSIKGSGILIDDEVTEIEETFNDFVETFERTTGIQKNRRSVQKPEKVEEDRLKTNDKVTVKEAKEPKEFREPEKSAVEKTSAGDKGDKGDKIDNKKINNKNKTNEDVNIGFIRENLSVFSNLNEENLPKLDEVITRLQNLISNTNDDKTRSVIEKILELLNFSKEKDLPLNTEIAEVVRESFETVCLMLIEPAEVEEDPSLIIQRITVLQQMLKLSVQEEFKEPEIIINNEEKEYQEEAAVKYSPVSQNTEVIAKNSPNEKEPIKPGESNTIKTLRVDTKKLDQLVSQVGELIIAKIKAKEHLTEIDRMIRSIEEWYREWNKTKQYFRHIDRPFKPADLPAGTSIYTQNRNINNFFEDNSIKLASLMNKMNSLYKIIQEDDARLNLIVNELEERIKSVRVLPLATIFHMFPRMVRDIARDKNKDIEFVITGSETSVDKKIIEEIKSPLIHIIRNSIDHGIEAPEERVKKGKNPTGKILLAAYHLENSVLIEITDDGCGIDIENIKRKVLQKELLTPEELEAMSEEQIMNIIFWPGFSTGETITDISGRGIGLDIVYTKISQLNGKVKIKSTLGKGCQVSIQLPVTMATIKSFLVEVNSQTFAIPTSAIKTTLLIEEDSVFYKEGKRTIMVDDRTVPICDLSSVLEVPVNRKKSGKLVIIIVEADEVQVGFIVDRLIGDQEILHKNLSPPLLRVRNVAGITTLGSGDLCLILNVGDLVKSAYAKFGNYGPFLIPETKAPREIIPQNILVVDDSATTRILERNILKAAGYNVTIAVNGLDALTKLAASDFDVIVSDVEMPEINGFELTERLRSDSKYKNIPIILVTSLASESDKSKGLRLGANAYITKGSFNQEEILSTIKQLAG